MCVTVTICGGDTAGAAAHPAMRLAASGRLIIRKIHARMIRDSVGKWRGEPLLDGWRFGGLCVQRRLQWLKFVMRRRKVCVAPLLGRIGIGQRGLLFSQGGSI